MAQDRLAEIERLLRITEDDLSNLQKQREFLLDQIASLKSEKQSLLNPVVAEIPVQYSRVGVTSQSDEQSKIRLFRALFRGREDVYARRFESRKTSKSGYQPDCKNMWIAGICPKPKIKCSQCDHRHFIPLSDAVIRGHLMGKDLSGHASEDFTIGVYPLLLDEMCWFLAVDFDGPTWKEDAQAFRETCEMHGISASLERSRSGNGAHIWLFFVEPVQSRQVRILGSLLLLKPMNDALKSV